MQAVSSVPYINTSVQMQMQRCSYLSDVQDSDY